MATNSGTIRQTAFRTLSNLNDYERDAAIRRLEKVYFKITGIEGQIDFQRTMINDLRLKWSNNDGLIVDPATLSLGAIVFWTEGEKLHASCPDIFDAFDIKDHRELITYGEE